MFRKTPHYSLTKDKARSYAVFSEAGTIMLSNGEEDVSWWETVLSEGLDHGFWFDVDERPPEDTPRLLVVNGKVLNEDFAKIADAFTARRKELLEQVAETLRKEFPQPEI